MFGNCTMKVGKMAIDIKKYEGQWVALDDKDRLISIDKELDNVIKDCEIRKDIEDGLGFKIRNLPHREIKKMIRYLLDYPITKL